MKPYLAYDLIILAFAAFVFYSLSMSSLQIYEKSPPNQRQQSFILPQNFTSMKQPLYSRFIFVILDGVTYDFFDSRIKDIPFTNGPDCDIHTHKTPIFNELLSQNPQSVVFQRLQIEPPPITQVKISTFLKGVNPIVFSMKVLENDPYSLHLQDSALYQVGHSQTLKKNYGFLTLFLYDYIGYHLTQNQFALDPYYSSYEEIKTSDEQKFNEYIEIIKSNDYDTLFIYEGIIDEVTHLDGMHTQNVLDAQKQVDKVIRQIVQNMDDDALLMIVSDHGKNEKGSHTTCRDEDGNVCDSLFFAYTKNGFVQEDSFIKKIRRQEQNERILSQAGEFQAHESMVSSTISNVLNVPISFINSGRTLFEVYPTSKFQNRVEMLQRVLQDSFTTLEQQKQFYQQIQIQLSIYDRFKYNALLGQIEAIENTLFYELRDTIIYSEQKLEEIILKIVSLQNQIQETIYETKVYSSGLYIFGIIACSLAALKIVVSQIIQVGLRRAHLIEQVLMLLSAGAGFYIYYMNDMNNMRFYGMLISALVILMVGVKHIKQQGKMLMIVLLLALNVSLSIIDDQEGLKIISIICEVMIFFFHSQVVVVKKKTPGLGLSNTLLQISIIFGAVNGVLRQLSFNYLCFGLTLIYYMYCLYIENRLAGGCWKKENFSVDLITVNLLWQFLGLFSNNAYLEECSLYYPIVLVDVYLLCYAISTKRSLLFSYFTQVQVLVLSAILYQILNLQVIDFQVDFSYILVMLFYFPLPFIAKFFKESDISSVPTNDEENQSILTDSNSNSGSKTNGDKVKINKPQIQNIIIATPETILRDQVKLKTGVVLFSLVSILSCCIGELWIIYNKKDYHLSDDQLIFTHDYIMSYVIAILISNIFYL